MPLRRRRGARGWPSFLAEMWARDGSGRRRPTQEAMTSTALSLILSGRPGGVNGQLDLRAIERVGREIGEALTACGETHTVVLRSTVLPGVTEAVLVPAVLSGAGEAYRSRLRVAVNPEFMREGSSLRDFGTPPFTLVGCDDPETARLLRSSLRRGGRSIRACCGEDRGDVKTWRTPSTRSKCALPTRSAMCARRWAPTPRRSCESS